MTGYGEEECGGKDGGNQQDAQPSRSASECVMQFEYGLQQHERADKDADRPRITLMPGRKVFCTDEMKGGIDNHLDEPDQHDQAAIHHELKLNQYSHGLRIPCPSRYVLKRS